jgi:phosphate-selective porin OprO/OprP
MTAKIGGKFAVDAATYITGDQFKGFDPGSELRRAFIYANGDCLLLIPVSYSIQIGYNANQFFLDESYLKFDNVLEIADVKAGGFKAPMSLDQMTSSRDVTLMEPAAPTQALAPGNSSGFLISQTVFDQRATWGVGLFTEGAGFDYGDASKDYGRAVMRFTGLPYLSLGEDGTPSLLHLGLSANILYSGSNTVRYRSRPESHLAPYVVDTGNISAEGALIVGAEIAWVEGPLSIQGEAMHSFVRETDGEVPGFNGLYATASWFLTGESRPYNRAEGVFGRVKPKHNFHFRDDGWGAWREICQEVVYEG